MSDEQFWDNGFRHFHNTYEGYLKRIETEQRIQFRALQWQTSILAGLQVSKKDRGKLEKALKLPWDDERKQAGRLPTEEDLKEFKKMDRAMTRIMKRETK